MEKDFLQRRHFNRLALLGAAGFACSGVAMGLADAAEPKSKILVLGDSLSAEYGLQRGKGWVALLQAKLAAEKPAVAVVNASISGDTTSGGRSRLPALLKAHQPQVLVIELGGNDALRGLDLQLTRQNLSAMMDAATQAKARVLLLGMQLPPNFGAQYSKQFGQLYPELAKQKSAALVPFFLKGVADLPDPTRLFQADRIHPNEEAQPHMLANVWPELKKLIP